MSDLGDTLREVLLKLLFSDETLDDYNQHLHEEDIITETKEIIEDILYWPEPMPELRIPIAVPLETVMATNDGLKIKPWYYKVYKPTGRIFKNRWEYKLVKDQLDEEWEKL